MNENNSFRVAGMGPVREAAYRQVLLQGEEYLPGLHIISGAATRDPANSVSATELRAGLLLGRITSGGKLGASILGVTTVAAAASAVAITVGVATAVELVRRQGASGTFKLTGPPSAAGTVAVQTVTYSAVNTSTGVITCSAIGAAAIAGSFVQPTDGSETILTFLSNGFSYGPTVDRDSANQDLELGRYPIGGLVDSSQIVNWPSDTSLITYVTAALNAVGRFVFDSKHGL